MDSGDFGGTVHFNVGGQHFMVFTNTLMSQPDCLLTHMANGSMRTMVDGSGAICIDRDPIIFEHILNYVRYGDVHLSTIKHDSGLISKLLVDAAFFRLMALEKFLSKLIRQCPSDALVENSIILSMQKTSKCTGDIVELNVGGVIYSVAKSTLSMHPNSMLGTMFGDAWINSHCDASGRFFIDRDGKLFNHVINFVRNGSQLKLPRDFTEYDQLLAEADFFQIPGLVEAIETIKQQREDNIESGIYLEVKDTLVWFRFFHINTSLVGPLRFLQKFSPFKEEFDRCVSEHPTRMNLEPFYTSWSKGVVEEIYLNFQRSKSRLEWAMLLKSSGWQLISSSCCSSSNNHDQTYIVVDKWFLKTDNLPREIFEELPKELLSERRRVGQQRDAGNTDETVRNVPIEIMAENA